MDFSSLNPTTSNALNLAARNDDFETVGRLLKKMNPNCIDNRGWTCLHEAAANDSYQSLMLILKHPDCRALAESHEGHTALYLACRHLSSMRTINALLESENDIANYGSLECVTPLHIAGSQGRIELIQSLVEHGAFIDVQDFDGDTPLHDAALKSQPEAVAALLGAGADPEIKNDSQLIPFHLACFKGCLQTIHHLFPYVADINDVTVNGDSPLILATQGCNYEVVEFLLSNAAVNPHLRNNVGDSALDVALYMGYRQIFKLLLSVTDKDKINPGIIFYACKPHIFKLSILQNLLLHDLGPEFYDFCEPFHVTLEQIGDTRPVYFTNAPFNSFLVIGEYIYKSSKSTFKECIYMFLMNGVSVNASNVEECPPIVYIHYCQHSIFFEEVFAILTDFGCDIDYCSVSETQRFPDAFIASLTSDPRTIVVMQPYSLRVEPLDLLRFANGQDLLERISLQVQQQLFYMTDPLMVGVTMETIHLYVPSLKHLSRLKIRLSLRNSGITSTKQFLEAIRRLELPNLLKKYIRYL